MSKMHPTATETSDPERRAPSEFSEIRELKEQLATLVGVVERQANVTLLQAEALRRQDEGIRRLETLLIQQTADLKKSRAQPTFGSSLVDIKEPLEAKLERYACILGWIAPTSATPESDFVLLYWCRSVLVGLALHGLLSVKVALTSTGGTSVFIVPETELSFAAATAVVDLDRGKGVAS
uniref:Uncharacterized protein n=1 Tax=Ananas comosus var. bracteatus TaxID=296719 RepID=A0A6V7NIP0_ANACO|nr:unnamed protein product [Ananas comosus var. bracteatus]